MYAFVKLGGHQHKVEKHMILLTEKTGYKAGEEFTCSEVLLVGKEKEPTTTKIGKPTIDGAKVKFKVLEDTRAPKVLGFKYKKRKGYRRRWGHRQNLQKLQVLSVEV